MDVLTLVLGLVDSKKNHNVTLFTSTDMTTWERHPPVFEFAEHPVPGIMFCPKVLYNKMTSSYVLWYNWIENANFAISLYGVATSPTPFGPFKVENMNVSMTFADLGDFGLYLDTDGQGYIIYTSHIQGFPTTHQMSVERLAPDFRSGLGKPANSGFFDDPGVEAPAFFQRNGKYFAVFGQTCCYCGSGSPVYYYSAPNPLGPYTKGALVTDSSIPSQQTNILPITTSAGTTYL